MPLGAEVTHHIMLATVPKQNTNVCSKSKQTKHKGQQMERDKKENTRKKALPSTTVRILVPRMVCLGLKSNKKGIHLAVILLCFLSFASSALVSCICFRRCTYGNPPPAWGSSQEKGQRGWTAHDVTFQRALKIILFHLCLISMYLRFFPPAEGAKIPSKWHTLFYVLSEYGILFLESSKKS